ncbi:MAG: hypothetical protein RBT74_00540 [Tenuifilaceae bacterium]|jgi:ABC-type uncharacterized transport system permease subunit|nr:hypothetical protein [Tenuifilaceae bacterium]
MSIIPRILEVVWLILAVVCLGFAIYATVTVGIDQSYMFFVLALVAVLMYFIRRHRRRTLTSNQNS